MYKFLIRPLLFLVDPERVHHLAFFLIRFFLGFPFAKAIVKSRYVFRHPGLEKKVLGLTFPNPVGLAAGFDKDARLIDELACFGFGFIEIGTLTPRAQPGNDLPRLFRLKSDRALINRMGFNNHGAEAAAESLKKRKSTILVGGNLGRNKSTANEAAVSDYLYCFEALYPWVDYFVVNVSSPNTPGLRDLQEKGPLKELLGIIHRANRQKDDPKPVLLKISPDLTVGQLDDIVEILVYTKTDGVIATNTTLSREGLTAGKEDLEKAGAGGLSGAPLKSRSTEIIKYLRTQLGPNFPIIGVGGIMSPEDAVEKLEAGADLVQVYTGFVYEGPGFVKKINREIAKQGIRKS